MTCVMLIDDDDLVLATLCRVLTDGGYEVVTATDGNAALSKFDRHDIDIVVTDIIMPDKEGIETILEFRKQSPDMPIIAMSGGGRSGTIDFLHAAKQLGASATLKKPFSPSELLAAVQGCLGGRE